MVNSQMSSMENRVKSGLREHGITCYSVYRMPGDEEGKLLMAFPTRENSRLTTSKVEHALNSLGVGQFSVQSEFSRLSAAFLHLEAVLGSRTEPTVSESAQ
jgi:hypothetical protein